MTKGNILITGASTGIGAACAKKFIQEGYTVYGSVRKQEDADRLSTELGDAFHSLIFDVTDQSGIDEAAEQLNKDLADQGLSLLINNAGVAVTGPAELLDLADYRRQFDINYFGLIAVTKAFLPLLGTKENGSFPAGKIINMSSIASKRAMPFMTPYGSSKAAVDSFSQGLRRELMIFGIDVVTFNPGPIKTPIWEKIDTDTSKSDQSPYKNVLRRFMKLADKESTHAIEVDVFAKKVYKTFMKSSPATSDVVVKNKFFKYSIPSLFSERTMDYFVKKMLKI
ncbi:MAG: SDR family oxidoreductase [Reichenbachiella sp.]|uniref:SDR family NAD(P)-dependent oxidoreductase n=1 Tax=Reichenbachiella sp. TaxID=2184521 RepID=UPI003297F667